LLTLLATSNPIIKIKAASSTLVVPATSTGKY